MPSSQRKLSRLKPPFFWAPNQAVLQTKHSCIISFCSCVLCLPGTRRSYVIGDSLTCRSVLQTYFGFTDHIIRIIHRSHIIHINHMTPSTPLTTSTRSTPSTSSTPSAPSKPSTSMLTCWCLGRISSPRCSPQRSGSPAELPRSFYSSLRRLPWNLVFKEYS